MLTPRENMLEVFRRGDPERIPLSTHVDPYNQPSREGMDPDLAEALGEVKWRDESTVTLSRYLGLDIMDYAGEPVRVTRKNVSVESVKQGDDTIETWHTPRGELRQVRRKCREDGTSYIVEHLVKSAEDLPILASVFEDEELAFDPEAMASIRHRRELIGDDGILLCFMAGTPLGMMYRVYSGVETLIYLHHDAPGALSDLFGVMERNYEARLRIAVEADSADAFVGMDDTSTTVISPAMFERYNLALTDARSDICHAADGLYFHHSCGLIRRLLPLYKQTRMDAVHAFTEPPIGDVKIREGVEEFDGSVAIHGGLSAMSDESWSPDDMEAKVRYLFEGISPRNYVSIGVTAFPHKTVDQMRRVVDACRRYRDMFTTSKIH